MSDTPDADADRTPEQGGLTPSDEAKAVGATAAAGLGCLSAAFIPYAAVILGVALLLVLGFFLKGGCAPSAPPGAPGQPAQSDTYRAPVGSPGD